MNKIQEQFGNIDIYLFDQLLKGRFDQCKKILDVGCGGGRNIVFFMKNGFEVYGVDQNPEAIEQVQAMAKVLSPQTPSDHFKVAKIDEMPFAAASFDLVICSAVLHFAHSATHFDEMLQAIWKTVKRGGYFFCRLASNIGTEQVVQPIGNGRYLLPDGTERFLVDEATLLHYTSALNGTLYERIKTTNVQNLRSMTTWCVQKK